MPQRPPLRAAAVGLDHPHVFGMAKAVVDAGAELVAYFPESAPLAPVFAKLHPNAHPVRAAAEILEDPRVALVLGAGINAERAPLGVEVMRHGKDFFVDKPGGVTIEDCRRLSDEVGDLIDVSGLIAGSYDLEVSSPGLDRELHKERELRWATGKLVHVWTREPVDGRREVVGRLESVEPDTLTLREAGESRRVPRDVVTKARLEVELGGSA